VEATGKEPGSNRRKLDRPDRGGDEADRGRLDEAEDHGRVRRQEAGAGGGDGCEEGEELTYGSDTMLVIDKLYSLGAKGHNI
jgi:hypothetical protein